MYIYLFIYTHTRRDCVDNDHDLRMVNDGGWSVNIHCAELHFEVSMWIEFEHVTYWKKG